MAKEVHGESQHQNGFVVKVQYDNRHRSAALMQGDPSISYLTLNRTFGSVNEALRSRRPGPIDFPFRNTHFYIKVRNHSTAHNRVAQSRSVSLLSLGKPY